MRKLNDRELSFINGGKVAATIHLRAEVPNRVTIDSEGTIQSNNHASLSTFKEEDGTRINITAS